MAKDRTSISENLKVIKKIVEENLPDGFLLYDAVYRDRDLGVFGKGGYSFSIFKEPDKMLGYYFGKKMPSKKLINKRVNFIIDELNGLDW